MIQSSKLQANEREIGSLSPIFHSECSIASHSRQSYVLFLNCTLLAEEKSFFCHHDTIYVI